LTLPVLPVADLVAVFLPLKRFIRQTPQKVCCNFNHIEKIFPGAAALGAGASLNHTKSGAVVYAQNKPI